MLEVLEGEAPGEPMKPLSELAEEMLEGPPMDFMLMGAQMEERRRCAGELQAWLREAGKWLNRTHWDEHIYVSDVRDKLLGTTQKAKQEGE